MKHHKHISPATLTALLFLALLLLIEYPTRQSTLQHEISTQVLRFHIRANSDTPADQQKKLQLKQTLLTWLTPILSTAASKQETIKTIQQTLPEITKEANRLAAPQTATVTLQKEWFPEKNYGTCTFPEGTYDALRIDIGAAKGHNWWCVLYPSLCLTDSSAKTVPESSKKELAEHMAPDDYETIFNEPPKVEIRFRLLELLTPKKD